MSPKARPRPAVHPPNEALPERVIDRRQREYYWLCTKHSIPLSKGGELGQGHNLRALKGKYVVPTCPCCKQPTITKTEKVTAVMPGATGRTFIGPWCINCDQGFTV